MQVVILAGGYGTRISEESHLKPKPMIEIGGKPILWHIMKHYSHYGFKDFIICCGYKSYVIKEYFKNYRYHNSDFRIDLAGGHITNLGNSWEDWRVSLIDTGENTMTGGRIKRIAHHISSPFALTYGDGVSNINLKNLKKFHDDNNALITMSIVQPEGRFGAVSLSGNKITNFNEKPIGDSSWINGGFMICDPKVLEYIDGDDTVFEREPLETIAREGKMSAFKHTGFWHSMDTLRDKNKLETMWSNGTATWKIWG